MTAATPPADTMRDRVLAVLEGRKPGRLPFVTRLEMWYRAHQRAGTLPEAFRDLSLLDVHHAVGAGQQRFVVAYAFRLRGVEVVASFEGRPFYREHEPVIENFPGMWDLVAVDKPGVTVTELVTPVGRLRLRHEVLAETVQAGADPYLREHLIKEAQDFRTAAYILERAEFVPRFEAVRQAEADLGGFGYAVPLLQRIPFQQALLEYLGETALFYGLYDQRGDVERLLAVLDGQLQEALRRLEDLAVPYVEFPDNLHGLMTNPRLFAEYCLPAYQRYTDRLHAQAKRVGSHTDGDVRPLLALLAESGLDVAESFSPAPLTACTIEEAWQAWPDGPTIWGGLPSPLLEARTSQGHFMSYLDRVLELAVRRPFILGVVDLFMRHNQIERVRQIAERVEALALV